MKILELEQGTPEWLKWRKTVITATECSILMGNNPWVTPYVCWQRKLGLVDEQETNEAMEKGKRLEPVARAQFILEYGIEMTPCVVESSEYSFLGASLDGISSCGGFILEVKCGGEKLYNSALKGEIPIYYMDQMQDQLLVTRAEKCFYYCFYESKGVCIEVFPDPEFEAKFIPKAREFLKCVAYCEPPSMQASDLMDKSSDFTWQNYASIYQEADTMIKELEKKKEQAKKQLVEMCADQNCIGSGLRVIKTIMRGRVDYDIIPELKDVDLNKYRKDSSFTWRVIIEVKK